MYRLAEEIPRAINFKLTADTPTTLAQRNVSFHVGYSWSSDFHWLCSSITDNVGIRQFNASYWLGGATPSNPWSAFLDIAKEIWESLLEIIDARRGTYRVFIAKDDLMAPEEVDGIYVLGRFQGLY